MNGMETIVKIACATPVVWRLTRMVSSAYGSAGQHGFEGGSGLARFRPEDILGSRMMDLIYWVGIWMSAQTALWVACGFAGVLLNWFALSGIAQLGRRTKMTQLTAREASSSSTVHRIDQQTTVASATEEQARVTQLCR